MGLKYTNRRNGYNGCRAYGSTFFLTHFRGLGRNFWNIFFRILGELKPIKFAYEITWPLYIGVLPLPGRGLEALCNPETECGVVLFKKNKFELFKVLGGFLFWMMFGRFFGLFLRDFRTFFGEFFREGFWTIFFTIFKVVLT